MSINRVKTTVGEQSFNFLTNQSSILHTVDTNKITVNGVNVIVDKPKRGDIMCITKYRKENGDLLEADKQKVIWIDGLSIEPAQLSQELEPVGICLIVKGNKAIVRYREEKILIWSPIPRRFELPESSIMNDGVKHIERLLSVKNYPIFVFTASSRAEFVEQLNACFLANNTGYSAELVELDTDLPATDTSDTKDGDSYRNRIIVNSKKEFDIEISGIGEGIWIAPKHVKEIELFFYLNNGFTQAGYNGGCCRAQLYDQIQNLELRPELIEPMEWIDNGEMAVTLNDFANNEYCQILRDNFATYDEYFDSMMVKYPCGVGAIGVFQCGKEDTYKLAACTYFDNTTDKQEILYPAAKWAASISLNAPKLGKGNWWLPSAAEMVEIMRDITYGTTLWETNPDIINRVLAKLTSIDNSSWSILSPKVSRWTSTFYSLDTPYLYDSHGLLSYESTDMEYAVSPITIYEF